MTYKPPEWLDEWLQANTGEAYEYKYTAAVIPVDDLRAFLSKFVLCEREPICTAQSLNEFPEGRPHPLYSIVVHDRGSMQDGLNLHAPAKGVP